MATPISVPDIGTTVDHVKFVRWLKTVGESVKRGEALCELETDKAVSELESVGEGVLLKTLVEADAEVEQGTVIAYVGKAGEQVPEEGSGGRAQGDRSRQESTGVDGSRVALAKVGSSHPIPPMIRNLAAKLGVDLDKVRGTGPGGRITSEDVSRAKAAPAGAPAKGVPLSGNQLVVARRVARSQREIPPIDVRMRIDMTAVVARRKALAAAAAGKLSYDAFFLAAVAKTMRAFPHFRARLEGETVVASEAVNVGVALGVGETLFTPVIAHADRLMLTDLDAAIRRLHAKAQQGSFAPEEIKGATFTLSNLGMYPVQSFSAVIPPDQSAVLAIGAIEDTPVVKNGQIAIVPAAQVTLTVDHRLINGREAAEFLTKVKMELETVN
ncbi:MAG: dihydrolipoamide acetyltransferase family protein [Kiritimatiellae bacterium]|nr:dihydrolipoamide acetyltransferase family protein [Kiritimatiellia bacterium]